MKVLVTGGAGYVGSHACKALAANGYDVVVVDNLSTGHRGAVKWGPLEVCDTRDSERLRNIFAAHRPDAVMHFAASAYVGESMTKPLDYYHNNVAGTLSLLQATVAAEVKIFVFSSTCAVYGIPQRVPISEDTAPQPVNSYGETKLACERMLYWAEQAHGMRWMALRYFNAAGADPQGEIGELHSPETHLLPLALAAAAGDGSTLRVFGNDYATADGTAVRDYIHVADLAQAHVKAVAALKAGAVSQHLNLGTGHGYSVRQVIDAVQKVTGRTVPHAIAPRRAGDPPALVAQVSRAREVLGWTASYIDIDAIIATAWSWHQKAVAANPWQSQTVNKV